MHTARRHTMAIKENTVVYIAFKLKDTNGDVLDEATKDAPLPFIAGREQIIPGLEAALFGKNDGDKINIVIQPDEAFGNYDEAFIQETSKEMFDEVDGLAEGMEVEVEVETEEGTTLAIAKIAKITNENVILI